MATGRRSFRIAEQVREALAWELQRAGDPRFNLVTITSVVLAPDLHSGKVYWMVTGGGAKKDEVNEAFASANRLFKRALSSALNTKMVPELRFFYDDTMDVVEQVDKLLDKAGVGSGNEDIKDQEHSREFEAQND